MTKPKLTYIEWEDAHSRGGWHTEKEIEDYFTGERTLVKQIGWVYKENKDYICIYSRTIDWASDNDVQYGHLEKIPRTWIRKRKVIKL